MLTSDTHANYWEDYSASFQKVKHDLIRHYLGGWFPILGSWAGRVVYVDTHAGRGRYQTGEPGSPLVALETLLSHPAKTRLLQHSEFVFLFIEQNSEHLLVLEREVSKVTLPARVKVHTTCGDAFNVLSGLLHQTTHIAPTFLFVDPYGFSVPGELLARFLASGRVEVFVNFMWRYINMAIAQAPEPGSGLAERLDCLFAGADWRTEIRAENVQERMDQAVTLFASRLGAKWWTFFRMATGGDATLYLLLHLTNHPKGRDLMKDCMWKLAPAGDFYVRKSDLAQPWLLSPEPDLSPLRQWITAQLEGGRIRLAQLEERLRPEIWKASQLRKVLKEMHREGAIAVPGPRGAFCAKDDPVLELPTVEARG